jgi:hypothetical protein
MQGFQFWEMIILGLTISIDPDWPVCWTCLLLACNVCCWLLHSASANVMLCVFLSY